MKRLKVNLDEIVSEMEREDESEDIALFDTETGDIMVVTDEVMSAVEDGDEEEIDEMEDWEKEMIETARLVVADGDRQRFVEIPFFDLHDLMTEFADMVTDSKLQEKLHASLRGRLVSRFNKVLSDHPREEEKWLKFISGRMRTEAIDWLNSIGIEPDL